RKAKLGYMFCLEHLQSHIEQNPEDINSLSFLIVTLDWYGQLLVLQCEYSEAYDHLFQTYNISKMLHGDKYEEKACLHHTLGYICYLQEKYDEAMNYLS
ncbi:hypothetical protein EAI_12043, partial [Harpegnathos saltator]